VSTIDTVAETLLAGTVLTTGTGVGMLPARTGERVDVALEGIGSAWLQL
jgi:2-keto-4-pentenoate hydratase